MTLTNKDKMMLGLLALVIFVAVFLVYGILPAQEDLKAIEADVKEKQTEVQALLDRENAIKNQSVEDDYNELLEMYYSTNDRLADPLDKIAVEKMMVKIFTDPQINMRGYSTLGWNTQSEARTIDYLGVTTIYNVMYVDCTTGYEVDTIQNISNFVDYVYANKYMKLLNLSITENVTTEEIPNVDEEGNPIYDEEGNPTSTTTTTITYKGSLTVRYMMQVDADVSSIPKLMEDSKNLKGQGNVLVFDQVANAVSYEFYYFQEIEMENGEKSRVYTLIDGAKVNASGDGTGQLQYSFTASEKLPAGTYNIVVRAVGDKSAGWYKSALTDSTPYAQITVA